MNELGFLTTQRIFFVTVLAGLLTAGTVHAQPYPEAFGADDFRISVMGPENNLAFTASPVRPSIAIRPDAEEGLIAWRGNDQGKDDIFVRRIRINGLGGTGGEIALLEPSNILWPDIPRSPDIACATGTRDVCVVVWVGEVEGEPRVFWRPIRRTTGLPVSESRSVSIGGYLGAPVRIIYDQLSPGAASVYTIDTFLILTMVPCGTGSDTTVVSIRIPPSLIGFTSGSTDQHVLEGRCLNTQPLNMAWVPNAGGPSGSGPIVVWEEFSTDGNIEIFASYGLSFGGNTPSSGRVSITNNGAGFGNAVFPDVAHDPESGLTLVVWEGNGDAGTVAGESEIHGQLLDQAPGPGFIHPQPIGPDDFRISFTDPVGSDTRDAFIPSVAWDGYYDMFAVTWHSDDQAFLLANNEFEAFMQGVTLDGNLTRPTALRLSRMGGPDQLGGTGDSTWDALQTVVATSRGRALAAWWGSQQMFPLNIGGQTWRDEEIWGQTVRLGPELAPEEMFEDSYEALP